MNGLAIIKLNKIEASPNEKDVKFYRLLGTEEGLTKPEWYSCWNKKLNVTVGKLYSLTYRLSTPDSKGRMYKNINDMVLVNKKDGEYKISNEDEDAIVEKKTVTTAPIQKSYSEISKENHNDTRLELVLNDVKELKRMFDDLATFVYNNLDAKQKTD